MEFHKGYDIHKDPRMIDCKTQCGNNKCQYKKYECWAEKSCANYKPPLMRTNADRIRAMSDEELAEWLNIMQSNAWHRGIFNAEIKHFPSTNAAWLDWLKQEVEM